MLDLAGKSAFVTGGVSGIGLGIARALAERGVRVAITYRREDHRDEALASLAGFGDAIRAVRADVSDQASVATAVDEAVAAFGKLHIVVNNAAVSAFAALDECTVEDWRWMFGVDLFGVVHTLAATLPRIKAHGEGGHILNVGSMAAFVAGPGYGIYAAAKSAVRGLTECLRYDLAKHDIGVSLLSPGLTRTNIHLSSHGRDEPLARKAAAPDVVERFAKAYALGMDPDEVGRRAVDGITRNALHIFSHPDLRPDVAELHREILEAFPDEEIDPKRAPLEEAIRKARREALAGRSFIPRA